MSGRPCRSGSAGSLHSKCTCTWLIRAPKKSAKAPKICKSFLVDLPWTSFFFFAEQIKYIGYIISTDHTAKNLPKPEPSMISRLQPPPPVET